MLPDRALYSTTFSHLLIVHKLLARSLARSLARPPARSLASALSLYGPPIPRPAAEIFQKVSPARGRVLSGRQKPKKNCTLRPHTFLPAVAPHMILQGANI